jgi:hypothetical protein
MMLKYCMKIPARMTEYLHRSWCLVVLNGPSGDLVPDLPVETFGCNGNFLRRRLDHVVSLDHHRIQFARQHGRKVWTRPRFCKAGDIPVPDTHSIFNDSGNAAIWAAHNTYNRIVIIGADSWLGGENRTVCDELYHVADKKPKLPPIWFRKFQEWSAQTQHEYTFVWPNPVENVQTITLSEFCTKYTV